MWPSAPNQTLAIWATQVVAGQEQNLLSSPTSRSLKFGMPSSELCLGNEENRVQRNFQRARFVPIQAMGELPHCPGPLPSNDIVHGGRGPRCAVTAVMHTTTQRLHEKSIQTSIDLLAPVDLHVLRPTFPLCLLVDLP